MIATMAVEARRTLAHRLRNEASESAPWWKERARRLIIGLRAISALGWVMVVLGLSALMPAATWESAGVFVLVAIAISVVLFALLEVLPGALGRRHAETLGRAALGGVRWPTWVMNPISHLVLKVRQWSDREGLFQTVVDEGDEDRQTWRQWLRKGLHEGGQRPEMIRNLLNFPTTVVREIMVPRTEMVVISRDMPLEDILVTLIECGHSRIPVIEESMDSIEGIFYAKDVIELMASGEEFDIDRFLRDPYFVPETRTILKLLTEFQKQRVHLAVVVDEFGGTAGLITLEDIVEEFFGDIQDEYDMEPRQMVTLSDDAVLVDAGIPLEELEEYFDVQFPDDDDFDSLAGFLLERVGGVPVSGRELRWEGLDFCVIRSTKKKIETVSVERRDEDESE